MRARVLAAAVLAVGLLAGPAAPVGAEAAGGDPDLVVEPADGLVHGQGVWLVGRGFQPGESVVVLECVGEPTRATCGTDLVWFLQANGVGRFRFAYEVRRALPTRGYGRVDCADRSTPCAVAAFGEDGTLRAYDKLSFDPDAPLPDVPRVASRIRHDARLGDRGQVVVEGTVTCSEGAALYLVVQVEQGDELLSHAFAFDRIQCGRDVPWTLRAEPADGPGFQPGEARVAVVAFAETPDYLATVDRAVATVTIRGAPPG